MRFTVFTHVLHKNRKTEYFGYAPYIREMNLWLKQFEEVEIVAPKDSNPVSAAEISYRHQNLSFLEVSSFNLLSVQGSFRAILRIPGIAIKIYKAMKRADHIHLRCPGNIGLIACFVQLFFPKKPKTAKYAGNWDPNAKQPWSYRLQKWILGNTFLSRNMKVLIYGEWAGQNKNIIPFFTASFSEKELPVPEKDFKKPFLFLFVGNLVEGKRPLQAIKLVEKLRERNFPVTLGIYGDGILKKDLEKYCRDNKLSAFVHFKGNQPLDKLKKGYKKAHFLVLLSKSEGWPKAVAEAMFFGCVPIATPVSCVPWMLDDGKRGVLLEESEGAMGRQDDGEKGRERDFATERIINLLKNPMEMKRKSMAAMEWSQKYTLEKFEEEIKEVS
ncbi:MAG TPA: glycosyltransferase [Salinimicrobium sp.]|nr:glycosyltransferase [Salinimicrobium sp.]